VIVFDDMGEILPGGRVIPRAVQPIPETREQQPTRS